MFSAYVHRAGQSQCVDRIDPAWLVPESNATLWVDIARPVEDDVRLLSDVFHFHPLSVEDARSALQVPKVERYPGYLYLVLHGDLKRGKPQSAARERRFSLPADVGRLADSGPACRPPYQSSGALGRPEGRPLHL